MSGSKIVCWNIKYTVNYWRNKMVKSKSPTTGDIFLEYEIFYCNFVPLKTTTHKINVTGGHEVFPK
jgi:hypothetical protein